MATSVETMWVADEAQLHATVQSLLARGGMVQAQNPAAVTVYLPKKLNMAVLVLGLLLCIVPGLVYLLWYAAADTDQQITVYIGRPPQIRTEHALWPGESGPNRTAGPVAGAATGPLLPPPPAPLPPTAPPAVPPTVLGGPYPSAPPAYPADSAPPRPETSAPSTPPPVPPPPVTWPAAGPTHEAGTAAPAPDDGTPPPGS
jgi:hypothetical protein